MSTNPPDYPEGYFGTVIASAFYGITWMQTFFYYVHCEDDVLARSRSRDNGNTCPSHCPVLSMCGLYSSLSLSQLLLCGLPSPRRPLSRPLGMIFVAIIWRASYRFRFGCIRNGYNRALNTVNQAVILSGFYKYYAAAFKNPSSPINCNPELILQTLVTATVAILAQGFLMHRIYVFSEKCGKKSIKIIALLSWPVLSILQLVATIIYVLKALDTNSSTFNNNMIAITLTLSVSISAGEDILIAILMVYSLVRERELSMFGSTTHMLQRLIVFAVNTGTWTALFALLTAIFLYVLPSKMLYSVFGVPLCSVYCNTILANLNARKYMKNKSGSEYTIPDFVTSATFEGPVFTPPELILQDVQRSTELATFSDANVRSENA